jgi:hypothetical protein
MIRDKARREFAQAASSVASPVSAGEKVAELLDECVGTKAPTRPLLYGPTGLRRSPSTDPAWPHAGSGLCVSAVVQATVVEPVNHSRVASSRSSSPRHDPRLWISSVLWSPMIRPPPSGPQPGRGDGHPESDLGIPAHHRRTQSCRQDECSLDSWVTLDGERTHYQSASVSELWTPPEMVAGVQGRVPPRRRHACS